MGAEGTMAGRCCAAGSTPCTTIGDATATTLQAQVSWFGGGGGARWLFGRGVGKVWERKAGLEAWGVGWT